MMYLVLAQTEATARALGVWLWMLGEPPVEDPVADDRCVLLGHRPINDEAGVLAYERLVSRIERAAGNSTFGAPSNEIVILVDYARSNRLNAMAEAGEWETLVAMLILTFPEIRFVFGVLTDVRSSLGVESAGWHELSSLVGRPPRDPLFDPTGLRDLVRSNTNVRDGGLLPSRILRAAAIDEERNYALFHAYTAYRFGFRADAVRSWALMKALFHREATAAPATTRGHGFHLLLEDVNINFPDKTVATHISEFDSFKHDEHGLQGRSTHCSMLSYSGGGDETSRFRVLVTSGHSGADPERLDRNLAYVRRHKPDGAGLVLKPVGGMYDLWRTANLFKRLGTRRDGTRRGLATDYVWPPAPRGAEAQRHSAPGKLMLIAQTILRRADTLLTSANSVEGFIGGAVLATDALELLRYQTPTLALQALSRKHEFEARAEVTFLGVGHHFDVHRRFRELEREVAAAAKHYGRRRARNAALDALVSIGSRLMLVFRDSGHFDEEMACLNKVRGWHRRMEILRARGPIGFVVHAIMGYAEWLLGRPTRFVAALGCWFLVFWAAAHWLAISPSAAGAASEAWNTFVVANPQPVDRTLPVIFSAVASATGVLHLGIFVSYLYSAVTRR